MSSSIATVKRFRQQDLRSLIIFCVLEDEKKVARDELFRKKGQTTIFVTL